jgi:DNA-binding transcriptional MerR regulator
MNTREPLWSLEELGAQVARALSAGYEGQASGRVREVPDLRTIRYYTTLGLIDRAAEFRGRTALYGRRHLLQLVAIKRLQAQGLSLVEVQERLLGLGPKALERLADVPQNPEHERQVDRPRKAASSDAAEAPPPMPAAARPGSSFWKEGPAPAPAGPAVATPLLMVDLREGVSLLLEIDRTALPEDVEAIRAAAAPLLKIIEARRLSGGKDVPKP